MEDLTFQLNAVLNFLLKVKISVESINDVISFFLLSNPFVRSLFCTTCGWNIENFQFVSPF